MTEQEIMLQILADIEKHESLNDVSRANYCRAIIPAIEFCTKYPGDHAMGMLLDISYEIANFKYKITPGMVSHVINKLIKERLVSRAEIQMLTVRKALPYKDDDPVDQVYTGPSWIEILKPSGDKDLDEFWIKHIIKQESMFGGKRAAQFASTVMNARDAGLKALKERVSQLVNKIPKEHRLKYIRMVKPNPHPDDVYDLPLATKALSFYYKDQNRSEQNDRTSEYKAYWGVK